MNTTELHDTFRLEVKDTRRPQLWSSQEIVRYMREAQNKFLRLTGGVSDVSSDVARVEVIAGEDFSETHPSILRFMSAERVSDGKVIRIVNETDTLGGANDYRSRTGGSAKGSVTAMIVGLERNKVRWFKTPEKNDEVRLHVFRTAISPISALGEEISDISEDHHYALLLWMKHLAYAKDDADTFRPEESARHAAAFENYCKRVEAEWNRYVAKPRFVRYGGL